MYFVLYDRFFNSIGETYVLESWSRTQRAVDLDNLKIEGEQIQFSAEPFLVVVNDRQGKIMFSGLASTPVINDKKKKTSITLKDYRTLWNSDILLYQSNFNGSTLSEYIDFVLTEWKSQADPGFAVSWVVEDLSGYEVPNILISKDITTINVYNHISGIIDYSDLYVESFLDLKNKKLVYTFKKALVNTVSVRLQDFGISVIEKSFGEYNRATIYDHKYSKSSVWILTKNNNIASLQSGSEPIYPVKNKIFIAEEPSDELSEEAAMKNAEYTAVMDLAKNRYQENVDLDAQQYKSILDLTYVDFSYKIAVYTDQGYYKDLPVGEIITNSKGKHIIRLGHRIQELTQEI